MIERSRPSAGVAGCHFDPGHLVNDFLQTSRPHIYAAGDVCGPLLYTHFAHYQGRVAAANMFAGTPVRADYRVVPRVTFTEPPIAGVGLTEEQALATGRDVRCALIGVATLGKALVESESKGLVKLVADGSSGEILGGHIAGEAAGEVIHEVVAAMAAHATVRDLAEAIRKGIAANRPYLIDVDIAADINPGGAGVWELPGLGQSKPAIGTRYQPD